MKRSIAAGLLVLTVTVGNGQSPLRFPDEPRFIPRDITVPLCGPDEPGKKLVFQGRVLDYQGRPLAKAAVMAHQADEQGLYVPKGATSRVPRLRGVAVTGEDGRFRFSTVWPGAYPEGTQPAHIHLAVLGHKHHVRFVTFWFECDPLLTVQRRKDSVKDPEVKIMKPTQDNDGVWKFEYDIHLEEA